MEINVREKQQRENHHPENEAKDKRMMEQVLPIEKRKEKREEIQKGGEGANHKKKVMEPRATARGGMSTTGKTKTRMTNEEQKPPKLKAGKAGGGDQQIGSFATTQSQLQAVIPEQSVMAEEVQQAQPLPSAEQLPETAEVVATEVMPTAEGFYVYAEEAPSSSTKHEDETKVHAAPFPTAVAATVQSSDGKRSVNREAVGLTQSSGGGCSGPLPCRVMGFFLDPLGIHRLVRRKIASKRQQKEEKRAATEVQSATTVAAAASISPQS